MQIGIALGSNLGNSREILQRALIFLQSLGTNFKESSWYRSAPVDCPSDSPDFLNAAVEVTFEGDLLELLDRLQAFECSEGRSMERPVVNAPRPVDLDLLYADDLVINHPRLVLPHPRITGRLFVLEPLMEICPNRILPKTGKTVEQLLLALRARETNNPLCERIGSH